MLTSHELFGFMSPSLANQILEDAYADERELYKATLASVANARRLRPVFLERQPRPQRHATIVATSSPAWYFVARMLTTLTSPRNATVASNATQFGTCRMKLE